MFNKNTNNNNPSFWLSDTNNNLIDNAIVFTNLRISKYENSWDSIITIKIGNITSAQIIKYINFTQDTGNNYINAIPEIGSIIKYSLQSKLFQRIWY